MDHQGPAAESRVSSTYRIPYSEESPFPSDSTGPDDAGSPEADGAPASRETTWRESIVSLMITAPILAILRARHRFDTSGVP